jgi:ABC-type branched-subunit amino acid transport system substrate-binding protein|tara:strand:- start:1055 stop:2242 length:1188 start_codon:yes stop_codon:yes gene_type:complete
MVSLFSSMRYLWGAVLVLCGVFLISACVAPSTGSGLGGGPSNDGLKKVKVAVLLPVSAADPRVRVLAVSAERAARMAMEDLALRVEMEMRIYDTAGLEAQAAEMALLAVEEGAQVIVGPLFSGAANAAGLAIASSGVSVLSLSNNVDIAGGNVYVLGHTFQNTASRLVAYASGQGKKRALIVHANNVPGKAGSNAIEKSLVSRGTKAVGIESYEFTQQDLVDAMSRIAERNELIDADVVFLTADYDGGLPLIAQLLPEAGIDPESVQYVGLSQWNVLPSAFHLPAIQGGWFAMPSPTRTEQFRARFQSVYGNAPHPLAAIAYDGVAAVGASVATGSRDALNRKGLTLIGGFQGAAGIFRLHRDGTIERGLAVATIDGNRVVVLEEAPSSFSIFGF